jgi:hypothetical protein
MTYNTRPTTPHLVTYDTSPGDQRNRLIQVARRSPTGRAAEAFDRR